MSSSMQTDPMTGQSAANRLGCPCCGAPLQRIPRRRFDRFLSLFVPMRRYRCNAMACHWEGRLPDRRHPPPASGIEKHYDRRID